MERMGEELIRKIARLYAAHELGWLNTREAAIYGSMNRKVLERLARKKRIQRGRHGREYRFLRQSIYNYLMRRGFDGAIKGGG